jgi:hypothetical protein
MGGTLYYLYGSVIFVFLVATWYDLSLEDEFLRNKALSENDKVLIDGLIIKRAKPRFCLRKAMFLKQSWRINKRVRKCLFIYFFSLVHVYVLAILYFSLLD